MEKLHAPRGAQMPNRNKEKKKNTQSISESSASNGKAIVRNALARELRMKKDHCKECEESYIEETDDNR